MNRHNNLTKTYVRILIAIGDEFPLPDERDERRVSARLRRLT